MTGLQEVEAAFIALRDTYQKSGLALPQNTQGKDKVKREFDCAVIQALHRQRAERGAAPYDSVRAAFPEDKPLFDDSGFRKRNHIQICILKPEKCIKGYFKPIAASKSST